MIKCVHYGPHIIQPWYESRGYIDLDARASKSFRCREPKPVWLGVNEEVKDISLFVCTRCFLYTASENSLKRHEVYCRYQNDQAGHLVYENSGYQIYELDATRSESEKWYMQCIALFGKFFLETKSICFAVDGFWIYVVVDKKSGLAAGFFSKETAPWYNYNLACIVTFPPFQRQGLGHLMIGYSYYLTRSEKATGTPEQPLSYHGRKTYLAYWSAEILRHLQTQEFKTIRDLACATGIEPADLIYTLQQMDAIDKNKHYTHIDFRKIEKYADAHRLPEKFDESGVVANDLSDDRGVTS